MELKPIGRITSPYKTHQDAPRQGKMSKEEMIVEIFPEYTDAMLGMREGDPIFLIYWGDRADRSALRTVPPGHSEEHGVFTTRSPHRPNPLAVNICRVVKIEGNILTVVGLDALDGSPLLDIKNHVPMLDTHLDVQ
ncbi:MAG: tRNA (N6-threonylcarbamoyladenosine(37)-N6)-methyltransferase TrmO [Tissierellia bacterium]|nr:tRNA (N6-threonylcarbamoyladenosine(37)-N6)-methyltransferase TrmO [Tissierellia bacterium]